MAKNKGSWFEQQIARTFDEYDQRNLARLMLLPVPTRVVRFKGKTLVVQQKKASPFDVIGYRVGTGQMIGAELKTSQRKNRLPIVAPGHKGDGIQFHQLEALGLLHEAGGDARVVWDNGGQIGVLAGEDVAVAYRAYLHVLSSEASGRGAKDGAKSLAWEQFAEVDDTPEGPDWLGA